MYQEKIGQEILYHLYLLPQALVISYSSDFIPRLVYMYGYSNKTNLQGYVDNILAGKFPNRPFALYREERNNLVQLFYYQMQQILLL